MSPAINRGRGRARGPDSACPNCQGARTPGGGMERLQYRYRGSHMTVLKRSGPMNDSHPLPFLHCINAYTRTQSWQEAETLLRDVDPDMKALAEDEIASLTEQLAEICQVRLPALLLPPSRTAQLSAILELKAGAGGDEASMRYATERGWKTSILSKTVGNVGGNGLKDVTLEVKGDGAFGDFRFERGVHRVQRVPATESAGRVHTSTIAVVVSQS
jgi:protein subunit release factor A